MEHNSNNSTQKTTYRQYAQITRVKIVHMLYISVQIYWTNRCLSYRSIDMTDTVMRYMNLGCSAGDACIHLDSVMFRNVRIQKKMTCCRSFQSRKKVTKCFYDLPGSFFRKKFSSSFQKKTYASHLTPHRQVFS